MARRRSPPSPSASGFPEAPPGGRRRRLLLLGAAGLLLGVAAYALRPRRAEVRRATNLDVILVSIDTLRADAVGAYGAPGGVTPWIDRLAAAGVRFERAYAHNVVTLPSHANMLSGRLPFAHGIRDNSGFRFPRGTPTLATVLRARGYRTGAFVSAFPLDSRFGLDDGFDVYDDRLGGGETRSALTVAERPGADTVAAAARWLAEAGGRPSFAFVHLYEPHFPYEPPAAVAARLPGYRGEVAAADAALEPILRPVLERGEGGRALVVLTSDHGEALGDHGEESHGVFAYEATLRVPLILHAPSILRPRVVPGPVGHADLLPTILDALSVPPPADLDGRSVLASAAGAAEGPAPALYFEALTTSLNQGWAPLFGVLEGGLKYIELPLPELYDLVADPGETRNLVASRPADVQRLQSRLGVFRARDAGAGPRVEEDAAARERLRALGYAATSAGPRANFTAADDPKALIALERRASEALEKTQRGDLAGAAAIWKEILARRPDTAKAHLHLAHVERARGDMTAAIASLQRAVDLRPRDGETVGLLATYLAEAGRARDAEAVTEEYARDGAPDLDVLTARAMALASLGRRAEALAVLEEARRLDPSNPTVLLNVGTVHLMGGDVARARPALEAALALDPGLVRAHNALGVIAAREGRAEEAVLRWRRAVELDPRDYQALFNLGSTLVRLGRDEEARPYLVRYLEVAPPALEAREIARVRAWLTGRGGGPDGS